MTSGLCKTIYQSCSHHACRVSPDLFFHNCRARPDLFSHNHCRVRPDLFLHKRQVRLVQYVSCDFESSFQSRQVRPVRHVSEQFQKHHFDGHISGRPSFSYGSSRVLSVDCPKVSTENNCSHGSERSNKTSKHQRFADTRKTAKNH